MKAIIWTQYGEPDVLELREIEKPRPRDNEVLIRVHAATVTAGDCELRGFRFPFWLWLPIRLWLGISKPNKAILGQELAGEIEAVGKEVKSFRAGDPVFAATGFSLGAYAEYTCLPEDAVIATKPSNMTYEEAAAVPVAGLEALHFLRKAQIQPGQSVLICGAGGSIGTFAVQIAQSYGAEVTGVDSTKKLDRLRSLGVVRAIDYTREDFTQSGETYDVIFDVMGNASFSGCIRSLKPGGRYLLGNAGLSQMVRGRWTSLTSRKKVIMGSGNQATEDLLSLKALIEAGKIRTVIDRRYPLEQTAEAHRYVETGQKIGNVVIAVEVSRA